MKRVLVLFVVLVSCLAMFAVPVFAADEAAPEAAPAGPLKVGDMLTADMKATDIDGNEKAVTAFLTKDYTAIQFMTTACSACQQELQELLILQDVTGFKLDILAVSIDIRGVDAVKAYEKQYKYGVKYALDQMFTLPPRFGFNFTPSLVVVDKAGKILVSKGGFSRSGWKATADEIKSVVK
jgi:thiol-disulfide isomerase/thioredoxin